MSAGGGEGRAFECRVCDYTSDEYGDTHTHTVADLATRLAAVQAERDAAEAHVDKRLAEIVLITTRAESAEAARDTALREKADMEARLAAVEALPGRWERRYGDRHPAYFEGLDRAAADLRAALANPSAAQREAEVGARAQWSIKAEDGTTTYTSEDVARAVASGDHGCTLGLERSSIISAFMRAGPDAEWVALTTDEAEVPR